MTAEPNRPNRPPRPEPSAEAVRRRFTLVALVLPIILVAAGVAVQLVALPSIPDVIAVHWDAAGVADGFAPSWVAPVMTVVVGLGIPIGIAVSTLGALGRGHIAPSLRMLGAVALATATMLSLLTTATVLLQRGATDPAGVGFGALEALPLLVAAALAGVAGWFLLPSVPASAGTAVPAATLPVAGGERVVWLRRVTISRPGLIVLVAALGVSAAITVIVGVTTGEPSALWLSGGLTVLLGILVGGNAVFRVRVDADGLTARSVLGFPWVRVPASDVRTAEVVQVEPMAEFGGWGLRWGPERRYGLVLRTGEGILVHRRDGRTFTVTVDDAATGASLLNAYAAR